MNLTNGAIDGQQDRSVPVPEAVSRDHTLADRDVNAGDRDLVQAQERRQVVAHRIAAAAARDAHAHARDVGATSRDQLAVLRDRKLAQRDASWADDGRPVAGVDLVLRAAENRRRLGVYRSEAIEARARAAVDREQASRDRELAARDRLQAQADRELLVSQLAITATDPLTGARTRVAGLVDLEHEIDRARRTAGRLVVAYVDVVGLKAINDAEGHAAGDALLRRVVEAIRGRMRSYDLIIRLGGDEFLCAMSGATGHEARERFDSVTDVLAAESVRSQIRVGFAALSAQDGADALIRRADAELLASRRAARTAVRHAT